MRYFWGVFLLICAVAVYAWSARGTDPVAPSAATTTSGTPIVAIALPESFSDQARLGQTYFEQSCASCHGPDAVGQTGVAPPLVHKIYEPSHHGDESFQRAVLLGVRGHHWPLGDMPAIEGRSRQDVDMIIAYIRELQRANGIN